MNIRTFALTYPQLISQAIDMNLSEEDLVYLRKGYEVAQELFDGFYRGQNVPFICHVVRTASILLAERLPIEIALAGLLHAAYMVGCFKDFKHGGSSPEHRMQIKRDLGAEVESLVFDYQRFPWYKKECVQDHLNKLPSYGERERHLVLIRLANELEEYMDYGVAYRGAFPYREKINEYGDMAVEIARRLGHLELAGELQKAFEANLKLELPELLLTNHRYAFQLPHLKWLKKSYFERLQIKSRELIKKLVSINGKD